VQSCSIICSYMLLVGSRARATSNLALDLSSQPCATLSSFSKKKAKYLARHRNVSNGGCRNETSLRLLHSNNDRGNHGSACTTKRGWARAHRALPRAKCASSPSWVRESSLSEMAFSSFSIDCFRYSCFRSCHGSKLSHHLHS
jgi:hypothetical protein